MFLLAKLLLTIMVTLLALALMLYFFVHILEDLCRFFYRVYLNYKLFKIKRKYRDK